MSIIKTKWVAAYTTTYCTDNPEATYGDLVQNCVKPALEKMFGDLKYMVDSQDYPCILLPTSDGKISATYSPCIVFKIKNTTSVKGGSSYICPGVIDVENKTVVTTNQGYSMWYNNYNNSGGNSYINANLTNLDLYFNALDLNVGYQFGFATGNVETHTLFELLTMPCKVLPGEDVLTGDRTEVVMVLGYQENALWSGYYKPSSNSLISAYIRPWDLPIQNTCANMYAFNDGNITIKDYYVCFPKSQTILKPLCVMDKSSPSDMWSSNEIVVNGSKFALALAPGAGSSGSVGITLARKTE